MVDKPTYNAWELAKELGIKRWKILDMLRRDQIRHTHVNRTHAAVRIPKEEYMRMVKGEPKEAGQTWTPPNPNRSTKARE